MMQQIFERRKTMEAYKAVITYANVWEMEDERTGRTRKGVTVEYMLTDSLAPVENEDGSIGYRHIKESMPIDKLDSIKEVPGVYNMIFTLQPGAKGKLQTKLANVQFLESL